MMWRVATSGYAEVWLCSLALGTCLASGLSRARPKYIFRTVQRFGLRQHHLDGFKFNHNQTNKGDNVNNGKSQTTLGLTCYPSRCHHLLLRFRHDQERPFGHIILIGIKHTHPRVCHFFMGWSPKDGNPIRLNGALFTLCAILQSVILSAAKAKLSALFLNCKKGMMFCLTLEELGHPQPKNTGPLR